MEKITNKYLALTGKGTTHIPHWEHWSNPDAETFITGIDHYEHPLPAARKMNELYPELYLNLPADDTPVPKPGNEADLENATVRWGDGETVTFEHGGFFKDDASILNFSPLRQGDFSAFPVIENHDYRDAEKLYQTMLDRHGLRGVETVPQYSIAVPWYYNTIFMWPVLTFGWEGFLLNCLEDRFEPIMREFAEISRRAVAALAKLPANFILFHDDICSAAGPICSREWMNKYVFTCYEEFWDTIHKAGKRVIFIGDGNLDAYVEDIIECGADGIISEPHTNFKKLAQDHPGLVMAGEGDNRILSYGTREDIKKMVCSMTETGRAVPGYFYCIGNHIPWNVPVEATKYYLDLCRELGAR
ncbi:MAG: uroporphyrinogen decarboxylase family protein [Victivallaceae bacterium]|nr:uroporphyrinogen decarboxylase family protein [Victivallaceae bacterium]